MKMYERKITKLFRKALLNLKLYFFPPRILTNETMIKNSQDFTIQNKAIK